MNMRPDAILQTLERAGFEARYVGGCVRDTLLGRPVHDWDIASQALPEDVLRLFPRCVPTGLQHGTVTVLLDGTSAEVTTYRLDGAYHDSRHPDGVRFVRSLADDLARRDFTINAMAMDLSGAITDLFGGREDLARGVIRCVGDAETRFREDALRMLRARRFAAQLGLALEVGTEAAIGRCAGLCAALSRERVREEAEKTLLSDRPALFGRMLEEGLLAACLAPQQVDFSALSSLPRRPEARWTGAKLACPALQPEAFRLPARPPGPGRRAGRSLIGSGSSPRTAGKLPACRRICSAPTPRDSICRTATASPCASWPSPARISRSCAAGTSAGCCSCF